MKIGYARVSTHEQSLALQLDALRAAGCSKFFTDHGVSGTEFCRRGLDGALAQAKKGDTLVVWRLDRLGRSLSKLVDLISRLEKRGVEFVSLNESINTSSSGGVLIFHMMAALAEFERNLISERTRAGIAAARARGSQLGRRRALSPAQRQEALELLRVQSATEVANQFNVHPRTMLRLKAAGA